MSARGELLLGVDLGSTKVGIGLWRETAAGCERLGGDTWQTLPGGPEPNLERLVKAAHSRLEESGGSLRAIGVSAGGPVDADKGILLSIPNQAGWNDVPLAALLTERLGVPARLENDANACALAEWRQGAGRGSRHMAFLTCSTGVGAGLVLDGKLHRGAHGLAGEVGHVVVVPGGLECGCGKRGCLEAYAGGAGMARRLRLLQAKDPGIAPTAREVIVQAREGDDFAVAFLRETAQHLATGLAALLFILDLDTIVLGTIVADAGELILAPLRRALAERVWPGLLEGLRVLPSALWPELGDHAALAVAAGLEAPALVEGLK